MSFQTYHIPSLNTHDDPSSPANLFSLIYDSVQWEQFSKGRQIAIISRPENDLTPLVRTTTVYQTPSQPFTAIHETIVDEIRKASGIDTLSLNHAMMEIYDSRYTTMGFHTDQGLDLADDSYICLFSCYEQGADDFPRVLTVRNKESGEEFEVLMEHHSAIVFSTAANKSHVHKIEGKNLPRGYENRWMGVTLRLAKSHVRFVDGVAYLVSGGEEMGELAIATDSEKGAFFRYKGMENREVDYEYPDIRYTISPSDRMPAVQR
ncbi:hypothetical protein H072_345 [Dactylellina haptotyla CBS 200.50]|uniref:Fe2OG dioxygenase domain-containing protein n=1 Tax=Dactylellina haptotyla (strain CBS 200.50) TaxID=1284197 RepID=S8ARP6_DACHA|nr:hypothetical protein H072_345 [Dactylellina haptotyla CBS 200.50]